MSSSRFVVLGLAPVRSNWIADVSRWATSASVPVDFVRCMSADEVRARLDAGRMYSAVLLDAGIPGLDRDLLETATAAVGVTLVVDDGHHRRDWLSLGASGVLDAPFSRAELVDLLTLHGRTIDRSELTETIDPPKVPADWTGRLVAVTGAPGTGASLMAMALAQGIASHRGFSELTLLADFALHADQAMLHDARDIVPGVQELIEGHRTAMLPADEVRSLVFDVDGRGYHLLLGLRRHRDWSVLRPRAVESSLDTLLRSYRVVVADVDADLEGEAEVGSVDIEERNMLARTTMRRADVVVAVGTPTLKGMHGLVRVLGDLVRFGVPAERIVPVLNQSVRSTRHRARTTAAVGELVAAIARDVPTPVHVPSRRAVDDLLRDGRSLPEAIWKPLTSSVLTLLEHVDPRSDTPIEPSAIRPGSLGRFADASDEISP